MPSFSTSKWLRKSSSLDRSLMFMILVGCHCPLSVDEPVLAAVGAIWPELEGTTRREEETNAVGRRWESGARIYWTYDRLDLLQRERYRRNCRVAR